MFYVCVYVVGRRPSSTDSRQMFALCYSSIMQCVRCCVLFFAVVFGLSKSCRVSISGRARRLASSRFVSSRPAGSSSLARRLVHTHAESAQVRAGQLNLLDQLLVRLGAVVESHDAPAEAGQDVRAEDDDEPEGELRRDCQWELSISVKRGGVRTTGTISVWMMAGRGMSSK